MADADGSGINIPSHYIFTQSSVLAHLVLIQFIFLIIVIPLLVLTVHTCFGGSQAGRMAGAPTGSISTMKRKRGLLALSSAWWWMCTSDERAAVDGKYLNEW